MSSGQSAHVVQHLGPGGEWVAEMTWPDGVTHGGPARLVIRPADPGQPPEGGVSSTLLRELDFRAAAETLRRQHTLATEVPNLYPDHHYADQRIRSALAKGVTEEYLALLASAYVDLVNHGQAKPLERLAEITGKTPSTIKGHLWQARSKHGLLTGGSGRAGGSLTPKAHRLLDDMTSIRSSP